VTEGFELDEVVGANVQRYRTAKEMSQAELAAGMSREGGEHIHQQTIQKIEKGTRPLKYAEAVVLCRVLGMELDDLAHGDANAADASFVSAELLELEMVIRARKALLDAIRQIDRWVNSTDADTEDRLIAKRRLTNYVELYTQKIRDNPAFKLGRNLGQGEGDNFAVYYNDDDRAVKQAIVDAVTNHVLIHEDEITAGLRALLETSADATET
jgi:transcriptional regulator with XRE-family HTH domain